jgi:hypothetical protein
LLEAHIDLATDTAQISKPSTQTTHSSALKIENQCALSHGDHVSQHKMKPSVLSGVPREIIRLIMKDIEAMRHADSQVWTGLEIASLAFTSRSMRSIIGDKSLEAIRGWPKLRKLQFLKRLADGLPAHIYCYYCQKMHGADNLESIGEAV